MSKGTAALLTLALLAAGCGSPALTAAEGSWCEDHREEVYRAFNSRVWDDSLVDELVALDLDVVYEVVGACQASVDDDWVSNYCPVAIGD